MESTQIASLRVADVFEALETSSEGLSDGEAAARRALYGRNLLSEAAPVSAWCRLLAHSAHPMALLLWAAGLLAFAVRQPVLGVIIWVVVLANAGFTFWQEHRAEQALQALRALLPAYARVRRDGTEIRLMASELVPGDLLSLAEGDHIPADARVVEEYGLRVNNATLTGEAVPARKTADASSQEGISELERPNLVFAGSSVVSGTGRAVVYATGMLTQFGRIARLTQAVPEGPSPLQLELARTSRIISLVALILGLVVFLVGTLDVGLQKFDAFLLALGILVAAVPEGLPATVTLSLAVAVQRLARRGVLVKKLAILETLGKISIICTDKSGTLTQNQMTVQEIWVAGQRLRVSGSGYDPQGNFSPEPLGQSPNGDLRALLTAGALCNNARLNPPTPDRPLWTSLGDQTEAALRVVALKSGLEQEELLRIYPRIHELPFDARRKRMSTIHLGNKVFVKGAPQEVLQLCNRILIAGEERSLDPPLRAEILAANDGYARRALRVLALAQRVMPAGARDYRVESVEHDLTFLGLMAMLDPPRPEVARAMQVFRQAGVRMVMITGDYGLTAESLARRVGLLSTPDPLILTGAELETMSDADLADLLDREVVYARMAPEHKLRLVAAFQARGEVVAVTGDGVNDAPALRKADVAIAMGVSGSDVAKEAADVILTGDDFSALVRAMEEGRGVFDNLRKFITYIFSSNIPEILPFILAALFDIPLALTVSQILAIDLGTDLLPALALGTERPEPEVMRRPPRRPDQPLVDRGLLARAFLWLGPIEAALCYLGFSLVYLLAGRPDRLPLAGFEWLGLAGIPGQSPGVYLLAVTVFHAGVVMAQAGNAFACRTEKGRLRLLGWSSNRFLLLGVAVEIGLILAMIYLPPLARLFGHVPVPPLFWLVLGSYAPALYGLDWLRKFILRDRLRSVDSGEGRTRL
jgi:magnesium-transporting ATPase (P-type)